MNWYKHTLKKSAQSGMPLVKEHYIYADYDDGTVDIGFVLQRPGATFHLITLDPVPRSYWSSNDPVSVFTSLKNNGIKLTTTKAKRTKDWQEAQQRKTEQVAEETEEPEVKVDESEPPKPEQLEFNFSSRRSKLVYKKARVNSIKHGLGDNLSVSDVDKEELIKGIEIELEHVGKGVEIPYDTIKKFVENQLSGISEKLPHHDILQSSQDIAMDHLIEIDDYYTRLVKMEREAEEEKNEKKKTPEIPDNTE